MHSFLHPAMPAYLRYHVVGVGETAITPADDKHNSLARIAPANRNSVCNLYAMTLRPANWRTRRCRAFNCRRGVN